jgi:hypothetical protein
MTIKDYEGGTVHFDADSKEKIANATGMWAHGFWMYDWADSEIPVGSLTSDAGISVPVDGIRLRPTPGRRFYLENFPEALDDEGEYWIDRVSNLAYMVCRGSDKPKDVVLSDLSSPLIEVKNAKNVMISNVTLEDGRGSGIKVSGSQNISVKNCLIRNFGQYGVKMDNVDSSGLSGCDVTGTGAGAISISGGDRRLLRSSHNIVDDCRIWSYARLNLVYEPGVRVDGVGNVVQYCEIADAPHQAIWISGNDNTIQFNDIKRVCLETSDSGSIYIYRNPTMRGNLIRMNRFQDISPTQHTPSVGVGPTAVIAHHNNMAVYLDDLTAGTTIEKNLFLGRGVGVMVGGGQDNNIVKNVFVNCHSAIEIDARGNKWAKKHIGPSGDWDMQKKFDEVDATRGEYVKRYPGLLRAAKEGVNDPVGNTVTGNVFIAGTGLRLRDDLKSSSINLSNNASISSVSAWKESARAVGIDITKFGLQTHGNRPAAKALRSGSFADP